MDDSLQNADLPWLIETYFSNPSRRFRLNKGETLLEEGKFNDRLYLVLKGSFVGFFDLPDGKRYELFEASELNFVGVYSFFSRGFSSSATVIAREPSELAFIEPDQAIVPNKRGQSLFEQFMPVVITNIARRQQHERETAFEREGALRKLIHSEKLASLGQMAAGIAHELNNAIVVMARNTHWLCDRFTPFIEETRGDVFEFFQCGLEKGRTLSSREVRDRAERIQNRLNLTREIAKKLAETGIPMKRLESLVQQQGDLLAVYNFWEIGATFHDTSIAAQLSSDVVKSVKALASPTPLVGMERMDVNESIRKALALLSSPLRQVHVSLSLTPLPQIPFNRSDLVQVWTNLIRNAIESMIYIREERRLNLSSHVNGNRIVIQVRDNGPGIPEEILPKIFQPNFTTKEKGLEFGLGLGLVITQRIINSYDGEITVRSKPGVTVFTVKLPIRD